MRTRAIVSRAALLCAVVAAALAALAARPGNAAAALPSGDTVQQWNQIAEKTVVGSGAFQGEGMIYMSYVSTAVYDALVAIEGGYRPYGPPISAPVGASIDCAVIEAAYRTLLHHFSANATLVASLDGYHAEALSLLNGCTSDGGKGTSVGVAAASGIIDLRTGDGRQTPIATTSPFETTDPGPGVWRLTAIRLLRETLFLESVPLDAVLPSGKGGLVALTRTSSRRSGRVAFLSMGRGTASARSALQRLR